MTGLITDPLFDRNRTEEYKLSIQVSLDGFSFSIVHDKQNKLLALALFPLAISSGKFLGRRFNEWMENQDLLHKKYAHTRIIYASDNFTFVPSEYYEYDFQYIPGTIALGSQSENTFTDNYLPNAKGNLVFPVPLQVRDTVEKRFKAIKLLHPATLLDTELQKLVDFKERSLVLYFTKKSFNLLFYDPSMQTMANCFEYTNPGDVLYYTLSLLKKIKVSPENTTLYMAGEIMPKNELHNELKKFFKRTIFFSPELNFNSEIFKEPLHRFIVLF